MLVAAIAVVALLAGVAPAGAATYPVNYDFSQGILAQAAHNLVVQKQCPLDQAEHVSMAADPVVAQDVLNALDPQHPAAVPCTLVLPLVGAPLYTGPP